MCTVQHDLLLIRNIVKSRIDSDILLRNFSLHAPTRSIRTQSMDGGTGEHWGTAPPVESEILTLTVWALHGKIEAKSWRCPGWAELFRR